jgi:hypothetical protein
VVSLGMVSGGRRERKRDVNFFEFLPQDLSKLGRDLRRVVIIDNSPQSYIFHPDNAVSRSIHLICVQFNPLPIISSCCC